MPTQCTSSLKGFMSSFPLLIIAFVRTSLYLENWVPGSKRNDSHAHPRRSDSVRIQSGRESKSGRRER